MSTNKTKINQLTPHDKAEILSEALADVADEFQFAEKNQLKDFYPETGALSIAGLKKYSIIMGSIIQINDNGNVYGVIEKGELSLANKGEDNEHINDSLSD